MSPDINLMRKFVMEMYDGPKWRKRVREMSDGQVTAIYMKEQEKRVRDQLAKKKQDQDMPF